MAELKFGRNYELTIQFLDQKTYQITSELIITPPFTIEFNIIRKALAGANISQIRILNLSEKNRDLIRYDWSNFGTVVKVILRAGYGNNLPIIFAGNITEAWSVREGIDFVTTITSFDGGYAIVNGSIPGTAAFAAGTSMLKIYKTLMSYLTNVEFGAIGDSFIYEKDSAGNLTKKLILTKRSSSYTGSVSEALRTLSGNAFFIDNNRSYILRDNEYILGQINAIDSSSGLLGTPLRQIHLVTIDMIFEPNIVVGQGIKLTTSTFSALNSANTGTKNNVDGFYKIVGVAHRGVISPVVCGEVITTLEFFLDPLIKLVRVT